jgi:hypothetical protein
MKRAIFMLTVFIFVAGCGVPTEVKTAICGNELTVKENTATWNKILAEDTFKWEDLYQEHLKTCKKSDGTKCKDIKEMRLHLRLRQQAHYLRSKMLKDWSEK